MTDASATCEALIREAARSIGGESPRLDAELLLGHATGWTRTSFRAWPERQPPPDVVAQFLLLVERRIKGEPVAHLLGEQEFWSLPLKVNPSTLIPRPDTECLVEAALALPLAARSRVLDLGTGTGAIALALASERPDWIIHACDAKAEAVALAGANAAALGLSVKLFQSDWFSRLPPQSYHLIVSNPPYVPERDEHLGQGDVRFEPASALVSGPDGLNDIRRILDGAPARLEPGGWLLVEHGYNQGQAVRTLFTEAGFDHVETRQDYGQRDRFTLGCRNPCLNPGVNPGADESNNQGAA
jgi:release factor glutamine methyltransferase